MNALKNLRARVTAALDGLGLTVYDHVPARPNTPAAVITPGVPYIEPGDTFGSWKVNLVVSLLGRTATNQVVTDELDETITNTIRALDPLVDLERVGPYYRYAANNAEYLATDLDIYDINDLKET